MSGSITRPPPSTSVNKSSRENHLAAISASTSRKRSRILFSGNDGAGTRASTLVPPIDPALHRLAISRRLRLDYPSSSLSSVAVAETEDNGQKKKEKALGGVRTLTSRILEDLKEENLKRLKEGGTTLVSGSGGAGGDRVGGDHIVLHREEDLAQKRSDHMIVAHTSQDGHTATNNNPTTTIPTADDAASSSKILTKKSSRVTNLSAPTPTWHAPWELATVISSHLGWVRSIAFDPTNDMFATGAADRTIKIFDFAKACVGAEDALKITLTGHIGPIRGLAFSPRHPYLFTAGEDKMVKCWDLETNQVVRHYHGH